MDFYIKQNDYFIRPTYEAYGIYIRLGINKAKAIFEGSEEECNEKLKKIRVRVEDILTMQSANPNYIFNLMMENMQRVTELKADLENGDRLDNLGKYDFSSENEMFRKWCFEYEFEYKMIKNPEDENFLETSERFFITKLMDEYGK